VQPIFLSKKDADAALAQLPPGHGAKLEVISPISPLYLPYISRAAAARPRRQARLEVRVGVGVGVRVRTEPLVLTLAPTLTHSPNP
jgi:hypothetical protein